MQTGDNGVFVGAIEGTKVADRIAESRPYKLKDSVDEYPALKRHFKELKDLDDVADYSGYLDGLSEKEIRILFDGIKDKVGRRAFG